MYKVIFFRHLVSKAQNVLFMCNFYLIQLNGKRCRLLSMFQSFKNSFLRSINTEGKWKTLAGGMAKNNIYSRMPNGDPCGYEAEFMNVQFC